jgi:Zn-dependent M28 family amino/carboxypeptidase
LENPWGKIFVSVIIIFALCVSVFLQHTNKARIANEADIKADVELVPCKSDERLEAVKKLFIEKGAAESDLVVEKFDKVENLVITKKGTSRETVVIGAHYDKVDEGCGAIDNWTGIVILANLYGTIKDLTAAKTYKFVAFDKEEKGLVGSNATANAISETERGNYCSMVNIDSFGFSYPQVLDNASSSKMTDSAKALAKEMEIPFSEASLLGVADADSSSFKNIKVPAITFHGLSNDWRNYLHTSKDQLKNVNSTSVYVGYQFVLRYLMKIDAADCNSFR